MLNAGWGYPIECNKPEWYTSYTSYTCHASYFYLRYIAPLRFIARQLTLICACVTWLVANEHFPYYCGSAQTHSFVWYESFSCVIWLISMCVMIRLCLSYITPTTAYSRWHVSYITHATSHSLWHVTHATSHSLWHVTHATTHSLWHVKIHIDTCIPT